ncbi:angiopoietin-4-like [Amphiura filiformis]|uniref:angiopoietin-4-like n=1 Tax=Amphiura filiformis TaxID=82378 RepID=UPI003B21885D
MDLRICQRSSLSLVLLLQILMLLQVGTARPKKPEPQQEQADSVNAVITDTTGTLLLALIDRIEQMETEIQILKKGQQEMRKKGFNGPTHLDGIPVLNVEGPLPLDCHEIKRRNPQATNGLYNIKPRGGFDITTAYCDMVTTGGGWTVIQRRMDGSEDFNRDWRDYSRGFGNPTYEHWLGNEWLNLLTQQYRYKLRVELVDWDGIKRYAEYSGFEIGSRRQDFRMRFDDYIAGNASDALAYHKGSSFTTSDKDNDDTTSVNCATVHNGGWWFKSCDRVNLNGLYYTRGTYNGQWDDGIEWKLEDGPPFHSLRSTEMKIKPM